MLGRASGFHDHAQRREIVQAAGKRSTPQAVAGDVPMVGIGKDELEDLLGEADGDGARDGFPRWLDGATVNVGRR